jgi:hypothetical protein
MGTDADDCTTERVAVMADQAAWKDADDAARPYRIMQEKKMDQAIMHIADSAYIAWSDFVEGLLTMRLVNYTTPGWVTYLTEETDGFIAWNDDVVERTISARPHS